MHEELGGEGGEERELCLVIVERGFGGGGNAEARKAGHEIDGGGGFNGVDRGPGGGAGGAGAGGEGGCGGLGEPFFFVEMVDAFVKAEGGAVVLYRVAETTLGFFLDGGFVVLECGRGDGGGGGEFILFGDRRAGGIRGSWGMLGEGGALWSLGLRRGGGAGGFGGVDSGGGCCSGSSCCCRSGGRG